MLKQAVRYSTFMGYFESSDELKEQRRERALRWLEDRHLVYFRPNGIGFSLLVVMLAVALIALHLVLFNAHFLMGLVGLAVTAHLLLLTPLSKSDHQAHQ